MWRTFGSDLLDKLEPCEILPCFASCSSSQPPSCVDASWFTTLHKDNGAIVSGRTIGLVHGLGVGVESLGRDPSNLARLFGLVHGLGVWGVGFRARSIQSGQTFGLV